MSRLILGLNTNHGDSSAALIGEQGIIAAIAEERISRRKHSAAFPKYAIQEVLRIAGACISDVSDLAVARDPRANAVAKAAFLARYPRAGLGMVRKRLKVHHQVRGTRERLADELGIERKNIRATFHQVEHHLAHVASAFFWSPFHRCTGFSYDGAGDFATTMWALCEGNRIHVLRRSRWPHSMGVFYTALTQYLGFPKYGEEYKVMGLSAYGDNRYSSLMRRMMRFDPVLGLQLDLGYFRHHRNETVFETREGDDIKLPTLWGERLERDLGPARRQGEPLTDRERDLAASMQSRHEEVFLDTITALIKKTGIREIVMAGGSALNSVANGRMISEGYVDRAYFQPAASDDGTAVGAAAWVAHGKHGLPRVGEVHSAYWGTEWRDTEIEEAVEQHGRPFTKLHREALIDKAAQALASGKIIGWFQGREEWGPRALGNRSILCNPSWPDMKATLNARIKNREPFRPFAPVIREEDLSECFEGTHPVPFMIIVYKVRPQWRKKLAAITHEDNTGRVQTVRRDANPLYYDLISRFKELTGIPALLNTSFNENEPIVHTPGQAIDCFERTRMDSLGIGSFWLQK